MKKMSSVIICTLLVVTAATSLSATSESNLEDNHRFKGASVIDSPIETIYGVLKNTPAHSRNTTVVGGLIPSAIKNLISSEIPLLTLKALKTEATRQLVSKNQPRSGNAV